MSETNFAALTPKEKSAWSREVWTAARDAMFMKNFMGTSDNCVVQRITDLTTTEKGSEVIMQLVADLVGDGVVGDGEREGNEEAMQSYAQTLHVDLISHGVKNKGKMSDQKTVINFREHGHLGQQSPAFLACITIMGYCQILGHWWVTQAPVVTY